jgi:carboxymethylenebutenolidase
MGYTIAAMMVVLGMIRSQATDAEIIESKGSFESQGKTIAVEKFEPKASGRHPAILVLHGAGGMEIGGPEFREFARELARRGYVAHVVHYFDQTGTVRADVRAIGKSFATWMLTIGDALTAVARQENVDPKRLGLLGFSLGSYLSLSVASQDRRVSAVVEYFGGLPDPFTWNLKKFPPTLILHGDADDVVPVAEARKLEKLLGSKEFPFEIRVYPGQGHRFRGDDEKDAFQRSLRFFEKHLKQVAG